MLLLLSRFSRVWLCNPIDGSPPGSPVPGSLQARTLEWVAISFSNAWKWKVKVKLLSRVRLSDTMDCSPPGSSAHRICQARVLEWGAIAFSNIQHNTWVIPPSFIFKKSSLIWWKECLFFPGTQFFYNSFLEFTFYTLNIWLWLSGISLFLLSLPY